MPGYVWRGQVSEHPCACGCGQEAPIAARTDRRFGHVKGERLHWVRGHNLTPEWARELRRMRA